jgi:hypothetical protein
MHTHNLYLELFSFFCFHPFPYTTVVPNFFLLIEGRITLVLLLDTLFIGVYKPLKIQNGGAMECSHMSAHNAITPH